MHSTPCFIINLNLKLCRFYIFFNRTIKYQHRNHQLSLMPLGRTIIKSSWTGNCPFQWESITCSVFHSYKDLSTEVSLLCWIQVFAFQFNPTSSDFILHIGIHPIVEFYAVSVLIPSFHFTQCHSDEKILIHFIFIISVICIY